MSEKFGWLTDIQTNGWDIWNIEYKGREIENNTGSGFSDWAAGGCCPDSITGRYLKKRKVAWL